MSSAVEVTGGKLNKKGSGAILGGWTCFAVGSGIMYFSLWLFLVYGPILFAAFILSIVALAQRRVVSGIALMVSVLVATPILWLVLSTSRLDAFVKANPVPTSAAALSALPQARKADANQANIPHSAQQGALDRMKTLLEEPIANSNAWEIQYGMTMPVVPNVITTPVISPDEKTLLFVEKVFEERYKSSSTAAFVVMEILTHKVVKRWSPTSWTPETYIEDVTVAPDGERIAYIRRFAGKNEELAIWDGQQEVVLPVGVFSNTENTTIHWAESTKIAFIHYLSGTPLSVLDLDTLKYEPRPSPSTRISNPLERKQNEERRALESGVREQWELRYSRTEVDGHPKCKLLTRVGGIRTDENVWIAQKDDTYKRRVLQDIDSNYPVVYTKDLRHIFVVARGLYHHVLTAREAPTIHFSVDIEPSGILNGRDYTRFSQYLSEGIEFFGDVVSPKLNPLTGKVVGGETGSAKGTVRFIRWDPTSALVMTSTEYSGINVGDVVTSIRAATPLGRDDLTLGGAWAVLESTDAPAQAFQAPTIDPDDALTTSEALMNTESSSDIAVITGDRVRFRDSASLEGAVLGLLSKGDRMRCVGEPVEGSEWVNLQHPDSGQTGWVHTDFVSLMK